MATRDMKIKIMAGLQELLAQQAVALGTLRLLHKSVEKWNVIMEGHHARISPPRPTPAEIDRMRYPFRRRRGMSDTFVWEKSRLEDPDHPIQKPNAAEMQPIPGITMASQVRPGKENAADTVDPTLIRD